MRPGEASVRIGHSEQRVVAVLAGELDLGSIPAVEARLRDALACAPREVVLDLSAVDFLDSTALALLFRLAVESSSRRRTLTVVAPPRGPARRVIDLVHLRQAATVVDTPPPAA